MSSEEFNVLFGRLEGAVYQLGNALNAYGAHPNDQPAIAVERESRRYEAVSDALAERLLPPKRPAAYTETEDGPPRRQPNGSVEQEATRLYALTGLDVGVALHACAVAELVAEPETEGPEPPLRAAANGALPTTIGSFAGELLPVIRSGYPPAGGAPPPAPVGTPSVSGEVDAIVGRACEDMRRAVTHGAVAAAPALADAAKRLCRNPSGFVDEFSRHVRRGDPVARRAAPRAWRSGPFEMGGLVGG